MQIRSIQAELEAMILSNPTPDATAQSMDVQLINSMNNPPPSPVTTESVYIRRCRLAGDALDSRMGRFHTEDLPKLLSMTNGVAMLVGHNRMTLPVARLFGGEIETNDQGVSYIVPRFYWMKSHSLAHDLAVNIDGGIFNQASISFQFGKPACSECGKDIRFCQHIPGKEYRSGQLCHVWYEDLRDVNEASIVYKGAQPGTRMSLEQLWSDPQTWLQWGYSGIQPWEV